MKYIILLLLVCLVILFLRHYLFGWRKKCYFCKKKITNESNAKFSWVINGSSAAVCDSCEGLAIEHYNALNRGKRSFIKKNNVKKI